LLNFATNRLVQTRQKLLDRTRCFPLGFPAQQSLFGILALVYRLVAVAVLVIAIVTVEWDEVDVHDRQTRHHETAERANVNRGINRVQHRHDQIFEIRVADHDLRIASTTNHSRVSLPHGNYLHSLLDFMCATSRFVVFPLAQAVNTICKTAMRLVIDTTRIESTEVRARLDQRGNSTGQSIALRVTLTKLGRQQIRQFDLANFTLNLVVSHFRLEIVFETVFAEQLNE
jgi:hypothetical protein